MICIWEAVVRTGTLSKTSLKCTRKGAALKKKIFKLDKMESLVFSDPKLSVEYDKMADKGEELYGYHYNETIMNILFNKFVLKSTKYLSKYKNTKAKIKNRRDKSGIEQLKDKGEKIMNKITKDKNEVIDETTSSGSVGGTASYVGYAGPSAWGKTGDNLKRKPIWNMGTIIGESDNYLTNPDNFKLCFDLLNEVTDIDYIQDNSDAYGNLQNMSKEDINIIKNDIKNKEIDEESMIEFNTSSISFKPTPLDTSTIERGFVTNESSLIKENQIIDNYTIITDRLKSIFEDRKPSTLVMKDRIGDENKKNFSKDLSNSGTKNIINVEKELQWKNQQINVGDHNKYSKKIEKDVLNKTKGDAFNNNADSSNYAGNEIPKRNITTQEQEEVNMYRLGIEDYDYDNTPNKRFEDRMKIDMGDELYKKRELKKKFQAQAPMYNKDSQPIENGMKKINVWNGVANINESYISGKYINELGKNSIINVKISDIKEITNENNQKLTKVDFIGIGNVVSNVGNINEELNQVISKYHFYIDENNDVYIDTKNYKLDETVHYDINYEKLKHLTNYNPKKYVTNK